VRVLVEDKDGEKVLGFEYLKPDTPIRPRDPEDTDPNGSGPDGEPKGGVNAEGPKPRAKRAARRPRGRQRAIGVSLVPKVPLGSK
jgi:ATP-dependent Clp protease ATP-binding subunit ClpA